jgi:short-subunit dehydrogenase
VSGFARTAVVTGASRGIGRSIAEVLAGRGLTVIGTSRKPENTPSDERIPGVIYQALDLTDCASIDRFVKGLERVDILINNAGASQVGPVEEVPLDRGRRLFELIFFGQIALIQGILPLMRAQGGGRILNITSFASRTPVPFSAFYAAGKSAFETLTLGLRSEVRNHGIQVSAIAPTFVRTGIKQETIMQEDSPYYSNYAKAKGIRDGDIAGGSEPRVVAEKVLRVLECKNPAAFYAVGKRAAILAFMHRFCPSGLLEWAVKLHFHLDRYSE